MCERAARRRALGEVIAAFLSGGWRPTSVAGERGPGREDVWRVATYVLLVGILLNAFLCGGFSTVNNRFEARVVWLIQLSALAGICVMRPHWEVASLFRRNLK